MATKKTAPRAKHKKNIVYTEDPIYNNRDYHFDWGLFGETLKRLRLEADLTQEGSFGDHRYSERDDLTV